MESTIKKLWITHVLVVLILGTIAFAGNTIILDKPLETANIDIMKSLKNRKTERSLCLRNICCVDSHIPRY